MKIAIVHDYLNSWGGAEAVVAALHEMFPDAPIYTSLYDEKLKEKVPVIANWDIRAPKWLQGKIFGRFPKYITAILPLVFESFDFSDYDLVISSSAAFAKGVITRPQTLHINYCHTPPRFLYGYRGETNKRDKWYWKPILYPLDSYLRLWDFAAAQRPNFIVANSETVKERIRKYYRREATVIYPPIETAVVPATNYGLSRPARRDPASRWPTTNYFLVVSRLFAYKNVDLVVEACNRQKLPLKVAGAGAEGERLKHLAGPTVELLGFVSPEKLAELYAGCQALIVPTEDEDLGMTVIEANAYGKPVLALRSGGLRETVVEGVTGDFFEKPTVESLAGKLGGFKAEKYLADDCRKNSERFSKEKFKASFQDFIDRCL